MEETRKARTSSSPSDKGGSKKRLSSLSDADLKELHNILEDIVQGRKLTHATPDEISKDDIFHALREVILLLRDIEPCKEIIDERWAIRSCNLDMKENLKGNVEELSQLFCKCRDKDSWEDFVNHDIIWKEPVKLVARAVGDTTTRLNISVQEKAVLGSWSRTFEGEAPDALWKHIVDCSRANSTYAKFVAIVQSSGMGKSRLIDELSKTRFVIPLNLREDKSQGFPPPDTEVRIWLNSGVTAEDSYVRHLSFLEALFKHTSYIVQKEFREELKIGLTQVAVAFRERMSADMQMKVHAQFRVQFYNEVRRLANAGIAFNQAHFSKLSEKTTEKVRVSPSRSSTQSWPAVKACNELCDILRNAGRSHTHNKRQTSTEEPLVILAVDEAHTLTKPHVTVHGDWSAFNELRSGLRTLHKTPLFALFLSTTGKISNFAPAAHRDDSNRIVEGKLVLLPPYTDLGFDQLAVMKRASNPSTLEEVTSDHYMAHLGRPLFGSRFDAPVGTDDIRSGIVQFAVSKLLNADITTKSLDGEQMLACLSQRLVIEFNSTTYTAHEQEKQQVQGHLRVCLKVDGGMETMVTVTPSEPILAEAAYAVMQRSDFDAPGALKQVLEGFSIHKGDRGELLVLLLLTLSRDAAIGLADDEGRPKNGRKVEVTQFISQLFRRKRSRSYKIDDILRSGPSIFPEGTPEKTFEETFSNCWFHFNHFIKVHQHGNVNRKYLAALMHRGAAILCGNNQKGIDGINPFLYKSEVLSYLMIALLLWQVKNDSSYTDEPVLSLFDAMDPYDLGIFDKDDDPVPIFRIVFALAAKTPCVKVVKHGKHGRFISYDIWCAGISPEVLVPIIKEEKSLWPALLQASYGWQDVYTGENKGLKMALNPGAALDAPFWSRWYKHDT